MNESAQTVWDPISEEVNLQTFAEEQKELFSTTDFYKKNSYAFKLFLALCSLVPLIALIVFIKYPYDFRLLAISFFPPVLYYGYVKHLQEQIILYLLCEKNGWPYNPGKEYDRPERLGSAVPDIIEFADEHDLSFDEQIWGSVKTGIGLTPFWSGEFEYTTGSGKNQSTHTQYLFVFKLPKAIPIHFTLKKAGLLRAFEEHIKTESEDFNNMFRISIDYEDDEIKTQILAILSPSVQVRLIDFGKKYNIKQIIFKGNLMTIVLSNKIWKTKYTNFFKSATIDVRDENIFYQSLTDMAELPTEMIQFIT